jgi:hypothetical protein
MNFTFTWILDKFGFQAKPAFDFPVPKEAKPVAKKATKVAKKTTTAPKATTRKPKTK